MKAIGLLALVLASVFAPALAAAQDGAVGVDDAMARRARAGIAADIGTTAIGIGAGLAEGNPIGLLLTPLRLSAIEEARTLPAEERAVRLSALESVGNGAAANNGLLIAAKLLALKVGAIVAPVVGVAVGYATWKMGEKDRIAAAECAHHEALAGKLLACNVTIEKGN